jgi:hypothetical protein
MVAGIFQARAVDLSGYYGAYLFVPARHTDFRESVPDERSEESERNVPERR